MLMLLGVVAFTTRQPPPPTIAEFAPNAVEKIEDAPEEQRSGAEEGPGACPVDEPNCDLPTPSPTPSSGDDDEADENVIDVPRVRKCVGDPPRQIEDPQSPPCVPYWDGDNGGATYRGVTATEIRIAQASDLDSMAGVVNFFNKRFELYGRKFTLVPSSEHHSCDPAEERAAAQTEVEDLRVFASGQIDCADQGTVAYSSEAARRGLIHVGHEGPFGSAWTRRHHPYLWQYPMEADGMFAHLGEWACKRLAGKDARHAGDPTLQDDERAFGVILETLSAEYELSADQLTDRLTACGARPRVVAEDINDNSTVANALLEMKSKGVTSVFCLCHAVDETVIGRTATAQGYFPEWLISSYDLNFYNFAIKLGFPAEQRENLFGIQLVPMQTSEADWPGTWACNETQCEDAGAQIGAYHAMLLIASGVQMAGPNLTPETFAEGLGKTRFPNPDHPIMAGDVGFDRPIVPPDPEYSPAENMPHGMTADGIEFWWSESAVGPRRDDGAGAMCYVDRRRYRLGEYPRGSDDVFFKGPCDTGS
jgi:hypothetical protein